MDLSEIRKEIDATDSEILALYEKRMGLARSVAEYKTEHKLPVYQGKREEEVLQRITEMSSAELSGGARLLFSNIMDISKCYQQQMLTGCDRFETDNRAFTNPIIACQGAPGSNSDAAAERLFGEVAEKVVFYETFEDVFSAVEHGEVDFGLLPIENSTAGDVYQTYDLMAKHNFFICKSVSIKVAHVLAAKKNSDIKTVYSHEQALRQCGRFLRSSGLVPVACANTAFAALKVAQSDDVNIAAICSEKCAMLNGLDIVCRNIADDENNRTRFICISKTLIVSEKSDVISLSLSLPHTSGSLYKLLTRFAYCGLNLSKIESKPLPADLRGEDKTADVIFYLDFEGNINEPEVIRLLRSLERETPYFKLLGNYENIK